MRPGRHQTDKRLACKARRKVLQTRAHTLCMYRGPQICNTASKNTLKAIFTLRGLSALRYASACLADAYFCGQRSACRKLFDVFAYRPSSYGQPATMMFAPAPAMLRTFWRLTPPSTSGPRYAAAVYLGAELFNLSYAEGIISARRSPALPTSPAPCRLRKIEHVLTGVSALW